MANILYIKTSAYAANPAVYSSVKTIPAPAHDFIEPAMIRDLVTMARWNMKYADLDKQDPELKRIVDEEVNKFDINDDDNIWAWKRPDDTIIMFVKADID